MPTRRPYDPTLRANDVQFLYDADDWFPDIIQELADSSETKLYVTGWAIHPSIEIQIAPKLTLLPA
jgi:hypothetical protein